MSTLTAQANRGKSVIAGEKAARTQRRVKTSGSKLVLDEASVTRARRLGELKGYVTNMSAEGLPAGEVVSSHHDLWHVEQSFRISKTYLRGGPIFHRTHQVIKAHLTIVFAALALSRLSDRRGPPSTALGLWQSPFKRVMRRR